MPKSTIAPERAASIKAAHATGTLIAARGFKSQEINLYKHNPTNPQPDTLALDVKLKRPWVGSNFSGDVAYTVAAIIGEEDWMNKIKVVVLGL